jgi:DnaJ homolog subfamily C member 19
VNVLLALAVAYIGWRLWKGFGHTPAAPAPPREPADLAAARALLGVSPGADEATIRTAHRRLVADAHPDRGGSEELTGRLNAARDVLLRGG